MRAVGAPCFASLTLKPPRRLSGATFKTPTPHPPLRVGCDAPETHDQVLLSPESCGSGRGNRRSLTGMRVGRPSSSRRPPIRFGAGCNGGSTPWTTLNMAVAMPSESEDGDHRKAGFCGIAEGRAQSASTTEPLTEAGVANPFLHCSMPRVDPRRTPRRHAIRPFDVLIRQHVEVGTNLPSRSRSTRRRSVDFGTPLPHKEPHATPGFSYASNAE